MFYSTDRFMVSRFVLLMPLLLSFLCPITTSGQAKPVIQVKFNMKEPNYVEFYNIDRSVTYIDSTASKILSTLLNAKFPFVKFIQGNADDQLIVVLDKHHEANANSLTSSVELSMRFKNDKGLEYAPIYITFREAGQALQDLPDDKDAFVEELRLSFTQLIKNKYDDILTKVCYNVKMCSEALPLASVNSWVMPFSMAEMKIAERSSIRVETKKTIGDLPGVCDYETTVQGNANLSSLPSKFRGKMRCQIASQIGGTCIENIDSLSIDGVYLTKYQPYLMTEAHP